MSRMRTCTRRFGFDYGHRLAGHEGKCRSIHGHRGEADVTVEVDALDSLGRAVDFGVLKDVVGRWIDEHLDHAFLVAEDDATMIAFLKGEAQKHYVMTSAPSAEEIAGLIYENGNGALARAGFSARVVEVVFFETPSCSARYP